MTIPPYDPVIPVIAAAGSIVLTLMVTIVRRTIGPIFSEWSISLGCIRKVGVGWTIRIHHTPNTACTVQDTFSNDRPISAVRCVGR